MTLDEAKKLLALASREELVDDVFGDSEVYWFIDGEEIADGYFGPSGSSVTVIDPHTNDTGTFAGEEAQELQRLGTLRGRVKNA